jgi:hypothetical protein
MLSEEISHDLAPRGLNLLFAEAFGQAEPLKKLFQRIGCGDAALGARRFFGQATPASLQNSLADFLDAHQ